MTNFNKFQYLKDWPENNFQRDIFAARLHGDVKDKKLTLSQAYEVMQNDKVIEKKFAELMAASGQVIASVEHPEKATPGTNTVRAFKIWAEKTVFYLKHKQDFRVNPFCNECEKLIPHHPDMDKCYICPLFKSGLCIVENKTNGEIKIMTYTLFYNELQKMVMAEQDIMTFEELQDLFTNCYEQAKMEVSNG